MPDALRTPAWRLHGLTRSEPGVLDFADGRLSYHTEDGALFDVPLAEVADVVFPWYYFGGGAKLWVDGEEYRFSFVRPNDASDVPGRLLARSGNAAGLATAGQKAVDIVTGRRAGKAWREILS